MTDKYILGENGEPIPCNDLLEWSRWFETADRKVAKDVVNGIEVSTVFLGLNHNHSNGIPLLFETMIFGGEHDQYQKRYTFRDEALEGHARALEMVKQEAVSK